jgi:hypothetical protein
VGIELFERVEMNGLCEQNVSVLDLSAVYPSAPRIVGLFLQRQNKRSNYCPSTQIFRVLTWYDWIQVRGYLESSRNRFVVVEIGRSSRD